MENVVVSRPASRLKWDVFLSFRGEDTRHTFTARLYDALCREQIRVFRDDEGLNRGDEIAPSLVEAIEDSAASVVVFSPRYADSHWCLEELAILCDLRSSLNRPMLPVFYGVVPSHVRHQIGHFRKDFERHAERHSEEKIQRWRNAMKSVGNMYGYTCSENGLDDQIIGLVVKRVLDELSNTPENVGAYTVGLGSRLEDLMKLVDVKSNSAVQVLGLHGMGGVGKTTLAKALYNQIVRHFEHRVFVSNVREKSSEYDGLISLQKTFISELFHQTPAIDDVNSGRDAIKEKVHEKKILAVLDDVDNVNQVLALAGERKWFGEGSLIVITTRDEEILSGYGVNRFYEVSCLNETEALKLFSYHALRKEKPTERLLELSKQMVSITGHLPLALEVFGSLLYDKREEKEWRDLLKKLKKIRPSNLQDILAVSFNSLDKEEQCVFLDIACLFLKMEMTKEDIVDVLKGCGFNAETALNVLKQKSLVKIKENDTLWMHDQLRDMGRQIVRDEDLEDPGRRSRLWDRSEIMAVLERKKGTRFIQGIVFDFKMKYARDPSADEIALMNLQEKTQYQLIVCLFWAITSLFNYLRTRFMKRCDEGEEKNSELSLRTELFESMTNLRLLQINHVKLEGELKLLPPELKWIQWKGCPLETLPSDFHAGQLAVLDLSESRIRRVWGSCSITTAENLKVVNLRGCHSLETIPDLSKCKALEKLVLEGCGRLVKIHASVGNLRMLLHLNLRNCSNLAEFLVDVSGLKHLQTLVLSGCSKLRELPEDVGDMRRLKELLAEDTAITKLPESIYRLESLEKLSLKGCTSIEQLPMCIGTLKSLKELYLDQTALVELPGSIGTLSNLQKLCLMWCKSLSKIPDSISELISLKELFINGSVVKELPHCLGSLPCLRDFTTGDCKFLKQLPSSICRLGSIVRLQLDGTPIETLPEEIDALQSVRQLELRNCKALEFLPESIGRIDTLHSLYLEGSNIVELPESIGMLENLVILRMNNCRRLQRLPESIRNLKSLHHLYMQETSVVELPEGFGMLSNLMVLKMLKKPLFRSINSGIRAESETPGTSEEPRFVKLPNSFSNLSLLEQLDARSCRISGKIPDDFEKLSSLEILNLGNNYFHTLPSSLVGLSNLRQLLLYDCQELKYLPCLPSSLEELDLGNCFSLETITDLSNLKILHFLNLTNCEKVVDIPGLECLRSLKWLYLGCCSACSRDVKRRLSKVYLRKLRNLSMPGSKIPDWFTQDTVTFSAHPNREIKGVILAVVVALNHESPDDYRIPSVVVANHESPDDYQMPSVVAIQAQVLKLDLPLHTHTLQLSGVPRTNQDQLHICRLPPFHPLVSFLKDGHRIRVIKWDLPFKPGVELKMSGIHLVYEDDDDYEGDEQLVSETRQTVSQKLANFFSSSEEDEPSPSTSARSTAGNQRGT